jgi:hypothetical protein
METHRNWQVRICQRPRPELAAPSRTRVEIIRMSKECGRFPDDIGESSLGVFRCPIQSARESNRHHQTHSFGSSHRSPPPFLLVLLQHSAPLAPVPLIPPPFKSLAGAIGRQRTNWRLPPREGPVEVVQKGSETGPPSHHRSVARQTRTDRSNMPSHSDAI